MTAELAASIIDQTAALLNAREEEQIDDPAALHALLRTAVRQLQQGLGLFTHTGAPEITITVGQLVDKLLQFDTTAPVVVASCGPDGMAQLDEVSEWMSLNGTAVQLMTIEFIERL